MVFYRYFLVGEDYFTRRFRTRENGVILTAQNVVDPILEVLIKRFILAPVFLHVPNTAKQAI